MGLLLAHGALVPAAALAVTKAGATWVQLHPRHPEERHRFILSDADIRLLLTDAQHLEQARVLATRTAGLAALDVTTTHAQPSSDPRGPYRRLGTDGVHTIPVPGGHGQFHREPRFSTVVSGLRAVLADRSIS